MMPKRPIFLLSFSLALMLLTALGIALLPRASAAAPAVAPPQQASQPIQFYTRTLATLYQSSTIEWLEVSDDWVGYSIGSAGCGHCGIQRVRIELQNVMTSKRVSIKGSYWSYQYSSGGVPVGIGNIKFDAPYLVWTQPGKNTLTKDYVYAAGDYDCELCYYNVDTGTGGAVASLQYLTGDPQNPVTLLDVQRHGQVLVKTPKSAGLWIGNLLNLEKQEIPASINPADVTEGLFTVSNMVIWLQGGKVYFWDAQKHAAQQIGSNAQRLRGHGFYSFWYAPGGIYIPDGIPLSSSKTTTGTLVVPGATAGYDANTTTALGDVAAYIESTGDAQAVLHVVLFGVGGSNRTLLRQPIASTGSVDKLSLSADKAVYVETSYANGYSSYNIQLVWLLSSDEAFGKVWSKADQPVASGKAQRSWLWGPQPNYLAMETYNQGENKRHKVLYYDKSRMEINSPFGDKSNPFYVSNGLLATEMIAGEIQLGDIETVKASVPCTIPVAGDPLKDNPLTPSYATLASVSSLHGENKAPNQVGKPVAQSIDVHGVVSADATHSNLATYSAFATQTGHNIPDLFWKYMQDMQSTYGFDWTFVLGYPISEAYWTQMRVSGKDMPVLIQAYQRRVLTYIPDFPAEWRVQMGNVGQHYYEWRYTLNARP